MMTFNGLSIDVRMGTFFEVVGIRYDEGYLILHRADQTSTAFKLIPDYEIETERYADVMFEPWGDAHEGIVDFPDGLRIERVIAITFTTPFEYTDFFHRHMKVVTAAGITFVFNIHTPMSKENQTS